MGRRVNIFGVCHAACAGVGMNPNTSSAPRFVALRYALEVIEMLRGPVAVIGRRDVDLARQVRRAASSVALNLGEGSRRVGRDRPNLFRIAAGSAEEVRVALWVAQAWGYLEPALIAEPLAKLDRILAITHSLTR